MSICCHKTLVKKLGKAIISILEMREVKDGRSGEQGYAA